MAGSQTNRTIKRADAALSEEKKKSLQTGRKKLLDRSTTTPRSVLFGTDSFWSGGNVSGEALSNAIITRPPFAVSNHPLIEAKLEFLQERGADPFTEYPFSGSDLKTPPGRPASSEVRPTTASSVILGNGIATKPTSASGIASQKSLTLSVAILKNRSFSLLVS